MEASNPRHQRQKTLRQSTFSTITKFLKPNSNPKTKRRFRKTHRRWQQGSRSFKQAASLLHTKMQTRFISLEKIHQPDQKWKPAGRSPNPQAQARNGPDPSPDPKRRLPKNCWRRQQGQRSHQDLIQRYSKKTQTCLRQVAQVHRRRQVKEVFRQHQSQRTQSLPYEHPEKSHQRRS